MNIGTDVGISAIGLGAGVLGALAGVGGGIIVIPALAVLGILLVSLFDLR